MIENKLYYDVYLHWQLTHECTFSCEYCISTPLTGRAKSVDIERVISRLDQLDKKCLITLTGGEPFLVPNFSELVQALTKKHWVRIDTNLSLKKACEKFMDIVSPERIVEITYSTHILERERRKLNIDRQEQLVKRFEGKGFKLSGSYVVYPPFMERIEQDMDNFSSRGWTVYPTLFVGRYQDRNYPIYKGKITYDPKELAIINKYNQNAQTVLQKTKNVLCQAGSAAFYINPNYDVSPCTGINKKIGNFFEEWKIFPHVIRCPKSYCYCAFNKSFPTSSQTRLQAALLDETIRQKGTASSFESFRRTTSAYRLLVKLAAPLIDALRLRGVYDKVKKNLASHSTRKTKKVHP